MTAAHWPADTAEPVQETTVGGVLREAAADTPEGLAAHPGVTDVAVVGVPDRRWGEVVVAFVRPAAAAPMEDELRTHCQQHLAAYNCPQQRVFVDAFPLTASGKIQKFKLREALSTADRTGG